jgi:hypothetical protein
MFNEAPDIATIQDNIGGKIFAVEPLRRGAPAKQKTAINEYALGVDVWHVDENNKDSWIANGQNDTIPNLHTLIYQRSSIHNSAINIISNLIGGSGWEVSELTEYFKKNEDGFYEELVNDESFEVLEKKFKLFDKNTFLSKALKKASLQMPLYGGYYRFNVFNLDQNANSFLRRVWIEDYENMRIGSRRIFQDGEFASKNHYMSDNFDAADLSRVISYNDFANGKMHKRSPYESLLVRIKTDDEIRTNEKRGVFSKYIGNITPYRKFYATPHYETLDALTYMDIDYMMSRKDWKDLESGFSLEHIIVRYRFKKRTEEAEKEARKKDRDFIKKNYRGFNGERSLMIWSEPHLDDSGKVQEVAPIKIFEIPNNDKADRYNVLREERLLKILNAHNIVTGEIIGLPGLNKTGLTSQSEFLIAALEQLYFNTVKPIQNLIVEDFQQEIIDSDIPLKLGIKKSTANFKMLTEKLLMWAFAKNEVREIFGHQKMTEEVAEEVMNRIEERETKEEKELNQSRKIA